MYRCPLCQNPLHLDGRSFRCAHNHCFDLAKEGYVNLLLVQDKKSRQPGDNKAMVRARRDFLNQGYYELLSNTLNQRVSDYLKLAESTGGQRILDLGCGEGYYTNRLQQFLCGGQADCALKLWGLDISKEAIRLAAKANPHIRYSVASSYKLPFDDASMDLLLRIYAPSDDAECRRVLKDGGHLITITPGPEHLMGLKNIIYEEPQQHELETLPAGFSLQHREMLRDEMVLARGEAIHSLLLMTPYYYNLDPDTQAGIEALEQLQTPIEFCLSVYQKQSGELVGG